MWILILVLMQPGPAPDLTERIAAYRWESVAECMEQGKLRSDPLKDVGLHGQYGCMSIDHAKEGGEDAATQDIKTTLTEF